jgi:hypothetical protein
MNLCETDKKRILSLPFYLAKRSQNPEPRYGQMEFDLFSEMTGKNWYDYSTLSRDPQTKITEFDYENYIHKSLLKNVRTDTEEFKQMVRTLNLMTHTDYEQHQRSKEEFTNNMAVFRGLDKDEIRTL